MRFSPLSHPPQALWIAIFGLIFLAAGPSTLSAPLPSSQTVPQPPGDGADLWADAHEWELHLMEESETFYDADLQNYLEALVERLRPEGKPQSGSIHYRVRVVRDAYPGSFAYPHGTILLHTGLLARIDNEAQLATILAHEMTHIENRHLSRLERDRSDRYPGVTAAMDQDPWEGSFGPLPDHQLEALFASVAQVKAAGYGQHLEIEAHRGVVTKLRARGYDVREAMRLYENLDEPFQQPHAKPADLRLAAVGSGLAPFEAQAPLVTEKKFARLLSPVILEFAELHASSRGPRPLDRPGTKSAGSAY